MIRSIILLLCLQFVNQQSKGQEAVLKILGSLPHVLHESSGLEITKNGNLWSIVDSKFPVLYNINLKGEIKRVVHLNAKNRDWEELAQDDQGNVYIGDFGNNKNSRRDLRIYKVTPPDDIKDSIISAGIIKFKYADQKDFPPLEPNLTFDMEAMVCFQNSIYLFSKNRTKPYTGYTKMYKLPNTPGDYVAELMDSIYLGPGPMMSTWVTGADISPDKKILVLLSSDKVWMFSCFKEDRFFSGKMKKIELNNFSQKEGICFINNTELYMTDELTRNVLGGNLYHLKLNKNFADDCKK